MKTNFVMLVKILVYHLSSLINSVVNIWFTLLSKIWYRHVISLTWTQMIELSREKIMIWYKEERGCLRWTTIKGYEFTDHRAFRRKEDFVMFKLRFL